MHFDIFVTLAGLIVGFTVGLTGMGGGALMTPILVLVFGITPLAAVSSDLVASMVMKPVGSAVHIRKGTVNWTLAKWLMVTSVPAAFCGVFVLKRLGTGPSVESNIKIALGVALLLAAGSIIAKAFMNLRTNRKERDLVAAGGVLPPPRPLVIKPIPTMLIGLVGGLVVGMTSVGSGSLIIVLLLLLYPMLKANGLVGTDLVQAVPLVASAAIAHILFGDFQFGLTASLLVGAIPGVYLGAKVSSQAPGGLIRKALVFVLAASGLKLVGMDTAALGLLLGLAAVVGPLTWAYVRHLQGFPWVYRPDKVSSPQVTASTVSVGSG